MSKSKRQIKKGINFIVTTGEPVFVQGFQSTKNLFGDDIQEAAVVRGVVTQNGIEHRLEYFPTEQLETAFVQAQRSAERTVQFEEMIQTLREKAESKRYALPVHVHDALKAQMGTAKQIIAEGIN